MAVGVDYCKWCCSQQEFLKRWWVWSTASNTSFREVPETVVGVPWVSAVVRSLGIDPESIEFDEDIVETGWSSSQ